MVASRRWILATEFCAIHKVEISFIHSLYDNGLIKIILLEEEEFIPQDQILQLEKMIRLYQELNINIEGIDTITHLLERIETLQHELFILQNKLRQYEDTISGTIQ